MLKRPTPIPNDYELLVAPLYAGLCGTDIQILRGLRSDPTPIIGHEGVARVVSAGSGVPERLTPGTLVCINPTHRDDPSFLLGHNVDGLLQERVLIPRSAVCNGLVLPLCEIVNTEISTLLEPLAVVQYGLRLLAEHRPHTLVVFGDGVIGHIAVRAAVELLGVTTRIVHMHHTKRGMDWSSNHPVPAVHCVLHDTKGAQFLSELPADERVAVLLATPRDATLLCLDTALHNLRGELVIDLLGGLSPDAVSPLLPDVNLPQIRAANCAGSPNPAVQVTVSTITGTKVCLMGHRGVANKHLSDAAAELTKHPLRYRELITHVVSLDEAANIMRQLAASRDRVIDDRRLIKLAVQIAPEHNLVGGAG
ncbi:alcohol dehydrogenase catalytic domain-containing protein [Phyllobacterium phragmitis]|uniref:alcohol dehydrogenase catalytic domain-containing protein n=1 Tax=Phyllobacterium phragmitis TaxID=2670329 RepID=UPI001304A2F7|nr:alcohol dehydrogenase catalytic domain-containing protein [Phyllobacterium phragmitis]